MLKGSPPIEEISLQVGEWLGTHMFYGSADAQDLGFGGIGID